MCVTCSFVSQNGGFDYIKHEDPDIFCVQETKCTEDDLPKVGYLVGTSNNKGRGVYTLSIPIEDV